MQDLSGHPFSPESAARESGSPDKSERRWLRFVAECERLLGHGLDGHDVNDAGCGYSLDDAGDAFDAGRSAHAYVSMVVSRERYDRGAFVAA